MKGYLMQMQPFSVNDGDGIRTTIFLAGCPLHCKWCANPEGLRQHPVVGFYARLCIGCGACRKICAHDAPTIENRKMHIDTNKCVGCGRCIAICPRNAIQIDWDETVTNLNRKIAEYSKAVVDGRPCFHISLVIDVSPNCDCHAENDAAIVPNVGMFASFDPVALDMACVDAVNAQPVMRGSAADGGDAHDHDHFHRIHPETDWMSCLEHAEKIGIGTRAYELIKI